MAAVNTFYNSVINEVIENIKTHFKDDGVDLAVFQDLKEIWERKIRDSGALEPQRQNNSPSAMQFANIMQQGSMESRNNSARIAVNNNPSARLIKPSNQNTISDTPTQQPTFNPQRISVPLILQGGGNFRQSVVPMVINTAQAPGMAVFSQYQHLLPQQQQQQANQQFIQDNSSLRKNQLDGMNEDSSEDDDDDLIPVSEVDPQSVAPELAGPSSVLKQEGMDSIRENDDEEEEDEDGIINVAPGSEMKIRPAGMRAIDDDEDDDDDDDEDEDESDKEEDDPLNSGDDVSEDDPEKVFECENVIVCQFDKVNRTRSKWKLNFVSGIANLDGRDTVFHKATGEAEW